MPEVTGPDITGLRVTQVRSGIGTKPKHRGTLRALGLGRIGRSNLLPDRPEIRGMIARVPHLMTVEQITAQTEVAAEPSDAPEAPTAAAEAETPAAETETDAAAETDAPAATETGSS